MGGATSSPSRNTGPKAAKRATGSKKGTGSKKAAGPKEGGGSKKRGSSKKNASAQTKLSTKLPWPAAADDEGGYLDVGAEEEHIEWFGFGLNATDAEMAWLS